MAIAVKALFFDVFGTLVDWRTSIAREAAAILKPRGHTLDWTAFAEAWRNEYQPGMEEVRSGKIPFSKLDVLHRRNLERILPRFGIKDLTEETLREVRHDLPRGFYLLSDASAESYVFRRQDPDGRVGLAAAFALRGTLAVGKRLF